MSEFLGLIAGSGELPVLLARGAVASGRKVIAIALSDDVDEEIKRLAEGFHLFGPGQISAIIQTLKRTGIREVTFAGKVKKKAMFKPAELDPLALRLLSGLRDGTDAGILKAVARLFEENGLKVIDQRRYLDHLLVGPGPIVGKPSKRVMEDIRYGISLARKIADLGIGQSVVVKSLVPLAVEAVEGTDEAIRRGAKYGGEGVVVAKATASGHDFRFDVPTVGPDTIEVMAEVRASALAVEAGGCFLIRKEEVVRLAEKAGISIIALEMGDEDGA